MKTRLVGNIFANIIQAVLGAGLLFALYRYINNTLGIEKFGLWSVVMATVSVGRLLDLGFGAAVIPFVARERVNSNLERAAQVVNTAYGAMVICIAIILPLLYLFFLWVFPYIFGHENLEIAYTLLPYAMVSLGLVLLGNIFHGGLEGCLRMDYRTFILIGGQVALLILAYYLVPQFGILGLAWAQIVQGLIGLIGGILFLKFELHSIKLIPISMNKQVFRQIISYGANIQAASILIFLLDPATKILMTHLGGVTQAGIFEMANQLVLKIRGLIVSANQAIVPYIATLIKKEQSNINLAYQKNMRIMIFIDIIMTSLVILWSNEFSKLLVGNINKELVYNIFILSISWGINIIAVPAYFFNMGSGKVRWNTISHIIIGAGNITFGLILGKYYGIEWVLYAYTGSIIIGSLINLLIFQYSNGINLCSIINIRDLKLLLSSIFVIYISNNIIYRYSSNELLILIFTILIPPIIFGLIFYLSTLKDELGKFFK